MKWNRSHMKFVFLVIFCAALLFGVVSCVAKELSILRTEGAAEPFGNYVRYENEEVIYLSPSDCFLGYTPKEEDDTYSEDKFYYMKTTSNGLMQITLAGTRCEDDSGYGWAGKYFVEAWYDFLEIPASRQTDKMFMWFDDSALHTEGNITVMRYTLKGKEGAYITTKEKSMINFEWELPEGEIESLQIYVAGYMSIQYPSRETYETLKATYSHSYNRGLEWEESISYHIDYIPRIVAEKEEATS